MRRRVLRALAKKHNHFVRGIASTLNTAALVAVKYRHYPSGTIFTESDIKNFEIVGDEIRYRIDSDYEIINFGFGISGLTHYIDKEGKCKKYNYNSIIYAVNRTTLKTVELPKLEKIPPVQTNWQFAQTFPVFERFYVPKVVEWGNTVLLESRPTDLDAGVVRTTSLPFSAPNLEITTSILNQTSNSGGVEGDLAWMIANAGVTVNFV